MKTIEEIKAQIATADEDVREARLALDNAQAKHRDLETEANAIVHGVKFGSIVIHDWAEYLVTETGSFYYSSKPLIYGRKRKKDGQWHATENYIGGRWDLAAPHPPAETNL
jgi:hypothetical protein